VQSVFSTQTPQTPNNSKNTNPYRAVEPIKKCRLIMPRTGKTGVLWCRFRGQGGNSRPNRGSGLRFGAPSICSQEIHMDAAPKDVTRLLVGYSGGNEHALAELIPLLYSELRRLASYYLQRERSNHTLQAAASAKASRLSKYPDFVLEPPSTPRARSSITSPGSKRILVAARISSLEGAVTVVSPKRWHWLAAPLLQRYHQETGRGRSLGNECSVQVSQRQDHGAHGANASVPRRRHRSFALHQFPELPQVLFLPSPASTRMFQRAG
jgi:hypothetical protein